MARRIGRVMPPPAVGDVVPDAVGIVVVKELIGHGVEELLGLFSPYPVHLLQPRIEHRPAMARQLELGAIGTADAPGFPHALIPLRFELIDALVQGLEEVGILDLGSLAISPHCIDKVFAVGGKPPPLCREQAVSRSEKAGGPINMRFV